jgi:hypothetical protein
MRIISLKPVTYDMLISSTIPESSEDEWSSAGSYTEGDTVKVSYDESGEERVAPVRLYQKTATGDNTYPPDDDSTNWLGLGATNRWGMFDQYIMTTTDAAAAATEGAISSYTIVFGTSKTTHIGLFNLQATSIEVEFKRGASGDFKTYDHVNFPYRCDQDYHPYQFRRETRTWSDYFFGDFVFKNNIVIPIPRELVSYTKITFNESRIGYKAKCGACACGVSFEPGLAVYGAKVGIRSFSRKQRDEYFGYMYLKKGNNARKMDIDVNINKSLFSKAYAVFTAADGVPAIFQGVDGQDYEPFLVYGFTNSFEMVAEKGNIFECNLDIEGLI